MIPKGVGGFPSRFDAPGGPISALVDSGAEESFIDSALVAQWRVPTIKIPVPLAIHSLSGSQFAQVTHRTEPVSLLLSGNHFEDIIFYVIDSPLNSLILGHRWLAKHNPHVNWDKNTILGWSPFCLSHCLKSAPYPLSAPEVHDDYPDLSKVPGEYLDLKPVFSKSRATALPPHRPYDCPIELQPGTSPPRGGMYSLSAPERLAMERYIEDSLAAGIIRPSSSPAGAGFYFVSKKDASLTLLPYRVAEEDLARGLAGQSAEYQ